MGSGQRQGNGLGDLISHGSCFFQQCCTLLLVRAGLFLVLQAAYVDDNIQPGPVGTSPEGMGSGAQVTGSVLVVFAQQGLNQL